jgi:hypothetical protein
MTRSNKLGCVSVVFFLLIFACARFELGLVLCAFFAILFGILAAVNGQKWWLVVSVIVAALVGVMLWAGFTAA